MAVNISGSVGQGGRNMRPDVTVVQAQLNALMPASRRKLAVDGLSGPKTIGEIREFQRAVCGFQYGDGRVDVGGRTLRNLNDPSAKTRWGGASGGGSVPTGPSPVTPVTPASPVSPAALPGESYVEDAAEALGQIETARAFLREIRDGYIDGIKQFIATFRSVAQATPLVRVLIRLRVLGYTLAQQVKVVLDVVLAAGFDFARTILGEIADGKAALMNLFIVARNTALSSLRTILSTAFDLVRASPLAAVARYYKELIGRAFDWRFATGVFEHVAMLIGGTAAHVRKVIRLIRECDPLGLAAANINAVASVVLGAVSLIERGLLSDTAVGDVIARVRQLRNSLVSELTNSLGVAVSELSQWRQQNWNFVRNQIPGWITA